jgi:hypothetical protein
MEELPIDDTKQRRPCEYARLCLEYEGPRKGYAAPRTDTICIPLSQNGLWIKPTAFILAHLISLAEASRLTLSDCVLGAAWLPFWRTLRKASLSQLSLHRCRFSSEQVAIQTLIHISHFDGLQSLTIHAAFPPESTTTHCLPVWQRLMSRLAASVTHLSLQNSTMGFYLGRGWIEASLDGVQMRLLELELNDCQLGQQGLEEVVQGLARHQPLSLQVLQLARNQLLPSSLNSLLKLVKITRSTLRHLDLSGNPIFQGVTSTNFFLELSQNRILEQLAVEDCHLLGHLAVEIFSHCRQLKSLNIACNPILTDSWLHILRNPLGSLHACGALLQDRDGQMAESLSRFLHTNNTLEELHLDLPSTLRMQVDGYLLCNRRLRQVRQLIKIESSLAIGAAACSSLATIPTATTPLFLLVQYLARQSNLQSITSYDTYRESVSSHSNSIPEQDDQGLSRDQSIFTGEESLTNSSETWSSFVGQESVVAFSEPWSVVEDESWEEVSTEPVVLHSPHA